MNRNTSYTLNVIGQLWSGGTAGLSMGISDPDPLPRHHHETDAEYELRMVEAAGRYGDFARVDAVEITRVVRTFTERGKDGYDDLWEHRTIKAFTEEQEALWFKLTGGETYT